MTQIITQLVEQVRKFFSNSKFIDSIQKKKNQYYYNPNQMDQQIEISIEEANRLVGSLKSLSTGLVMKGYYLPNFQSSCINSEYLLGVALKKAFTCKSQDVKMAYLIKNATKIDLYRELFQLIGQETDLGFNSEKLPNQECLVNVLFLVSPQYTYFQKPSLNMLRGFSLQDIQKLKELNTSMFRSKRLRIFKNSNQNLQQKKATKIKAQIQKLKTQLEEETKRQTNKIGQLQMLKSTLKNIEQEITQVQNDNLNAQAFQRNFELQELIQSD